MLGLSIMNWAREDHAVIYRPLVGSARFYHNWPLASVLCIDFKASLAAQPIKCLEKLEAHARNRAGKPTASRSAFCGFIAAIAAVVDTITNINL